MSAKSNQSNLEAAIGKLQAFCSAHTSLKKDEQFSATFESFFRKANAGFETFEAREEVVAVLYDIEAYLMSPGREEEAKVSPPVDAGNRLFASLKRHPE